MPSDGDRAYRGGYVTGGPGRAGRSEHRGAAHGFGIVGCGVIAATHAEAIGAIGGARLVAVTDASRKSRA